MTTQSFRMTSWVGPALRHVSAHSNRDILDFQFAGMGKVNRWNLPGTRTLYLAGDRGVLIAEWGRHLDPRFPEDIVSASFAQRDVYQLQVRLDRILDLRDPEVASSLGLIDVPQSFLNIDRTRLAAHMVRSTTNAQGMLVPSVAFLDDMTRWNLVVFLEKMPTETYSWITEVKKIGPLHWR